MVDSFIITLLKESSMNTFTYVVAGDPIPWKRAGINGKRFFDKQTKEKLYYGITLKSQHPQDIPFDGPLSLEVFFYMKIPYTQARKRKEEMINTYHTQVPDASNLVKFVEDAANGILFLDDKQISCIHAYKIWTMEPRTVIRLSPLDKVVFDNGKI